MKRRKTNSAYSVFLLLFILAILSFSSNPPDGNTGGPGEGTCANCHSTPPAGVNGLVTIEGLPSPVIVNTTYTLTVRAEATMGSPATGGFQLVALNSSNQNTGDLIPTSGDVGTNTAGNGREYVEHRGDKAFSGSEVSWNFNWKAPATAGTVNMYAAANLANNNGSNSGDRIVLTTTSATVSGGNPPPSVVVTTTDVLCNGENTGTATATVSDGTPPYSYAWSNGGTTSTMTNLPAGFYAVTVTDAGSLMAFSSAMVLEPPPLLVTLFPTDVSCFGICDGTLDAEVDGGASGYSYQWNDPAGSTAPNIANLCPGDYTLTLTDANGCVVITTATVQAVPAITISTSSTNAICFDQCNGTATANASGGVGILTYQWNDPIFQNTATATQLCPGIYVVTVSDANGCTNTATVSIENPEQVILTSSSTEVICFGNCDGTATITASGGTPGYTYSWSDGQNSATATNLCAGDYQCTVTDGAGCTATSTVTVASPAPIQLSGLITNSDCSGSCSGGIDLSTNGGTAPLSVLWSDDNTMEDRTGLCAGAYSVTVTDINGCTATDNFFIDAPPIIDPVATVVPVSCNGSCDGSITLNVTGGSPPLSFAWAYANGGSSNLQNLVDLCADLYMLTITDNVGCSLTLFVEVSEPDPIDASVSITNPLCNGDCTGGASLTITGGNPPYTYQWDAQTGSQVAATATNLCAGFYSVTVTDIDGCSAAFNDIAFINQPTPISPNATVTAETTAGGNDGTASVNPVGGRSPYSILWSNGMTTSSISGLAPATYSVTVTDNNGCTETASVTVNAFDCQITLSTSTSDVLCAGGMTGSATATADNGTAPYSYLWSNGATGPNLNNVENGGYTVTATDANNCAVTATVLIFEPDELELTFTKTDASCGGTCDGSIRLFANAGTPPYSYSWDSGSSTGSTRDKLCPGVYSATLTDANGCTIATTITINSPSSLNVSVSTTDETAPGANDGTAAATVTGGTPGYSYLWSNGATTAFTNNLSPGTYAISVSDAVGCTAVAIGIVEEAVCAMVVTVTPLNVFCNGGSTGTAIATVGNGEPPYSYQWSSGGASNPETGLMAGNYTLTVTDAFGCIKIVDFSIGEPAPISATITTVRGLSCNGASDGVASVIPGGGTGPYTIFWSNGGSNTTQNNLPATGTVKITDSNGCIEIFPYTLPEPPALTVSMSNTSETTLGAMDGTATANPSGGTPPYTYLWSNAEITATISGLSPGTYTVTVTDANNCQITNTTEVNAGGCDLVLESLTTVDILCADGPMGMATILVTGGTLPYTYLWSSGGNTATETGLNAGTYSVTVFDANSCVVSTPFSIFELAPLQLEISSQTRIQCGGDATATATVFASGGTSPYTYVWPGGGSMATQNGLTNTTYIVSVTDANMCESTVAITIESIDTEAPIIDPLPDDLTLYLDNMGMATLAVGDLNASSTDNCGTLTATIDLSDFDCNAVGENLVTYTATDDSGNSTTATFMVTVQDTLLPMVVAQDITVYLDENGLANITANDLDGGSSDNCGIDSLVTDLMEFDCGSIGENKVYLVGFDTNGNCATDSAIVTVLDTIAPVLLCPGDLMAENCETTVTYTLDFSDNCLMAAPVLVDGLPSGAVFPTGSTTVSYSLSDLSGNEVTCTFSVTVPDYAITASLGIVSTPCPGELTGVLEATVAGGTAPYEYQWNDPMQQTSAAATGLAGGTTYTVKITDSQGCDTLEISMFLPESPAVQIDLVSVTDDTDGQGTGAIEVTVAGGVPPYTYQWARDGMAVASTEDLTDLIAGTYVLEVTDANGCVFLSDSIVVDNITATKNPREAFNISLVPNPNDGHFVIYFDADSYRHRHPEWQLTLWDVSGRMVYRQIEKVSAGKIEISQNHLAEGLYLLRLESADGVWVKKVMVERF